MADLFSHVISLTYVSDMLKSMPYLLSFVDYWAQYPWKPFQLSHSMWSSLNEAEVAIHSVRVVSDEIILSAPISLSDIKAILLDIANHNNPL